jgi:hypothetical protein
MAVRRPYGKVPRHALTPSEREELRERIVGLLNVGAVAQQVRDRLARPPRQMSEDEDAALDGAGDGAVDGTLAEPVGVGPKGAARPDGRKAPAPARPRVHANDGTVRASLSGHQPRQKEAPCSRA